MARDLKEIEREIARARDSLALTIDELATRTAPKRFVAAGKSKLQTQLEDPKIRYSLIAVGALIGFVIVRKLLR